MALREGEGAHPADGDGGDLPGGSGGASRAGDHARGETSEGEHPVRENDALCENWTMAALAQLARRATRTVGAARWRSMAAAAEPSRLVGLSGAEIVHQLMIDHGVEMVCARPDPHRPLHATPPPQP